VNRVEYDSYGNVVAEVNPAAGDRFKFTGQDYDAETGLYWYWMRYYDPGVGRFTTCDPLGIAAGDLNLTRYVNNSPTTSTDPTGGTDASEEGALSGNQLRQIAQAKQAYQKNKKFREYFHRFYKNKQGMSGGGKNNPDMDWLEVFEALEEFVLL